MLATKADLFAVEVITSTVHDNIFWIQVFSINSLGFINTRRSCLAT
jgi:hypothetical protein